MIENPWEWANEIGHAFRTHDDIIASWDSVLEILDVHAQVVHYGGPGHWADPGTFIWRHRATANSVTISSLLILAHITLC
jgi:hypothetical protein